MAMNRNQQNAVYLQSGDPETEARPSVGNYGGGLLNQPDPYIGGQLGNLLTVADPGDSKKSKQYRLVKNDSVMDVLPSEGAVMYWRDRATYLVTTDVSVAGRGNVAGVARCVSAVGDIICVQRRGDATVLIQGGPTAAPTAAGLNVIPSATDAVADVLAAGSAATYPKLGQSVSVASGSPSRFTAALAVEDGMAEG